MDKQEELDNLPEEIEGNAQDPRIHRKHLQSYRARVQFIEMLSENGIVTVADWNRLLPDLSFDPRFNAIQFL